MTRAPRPLTLKPGWQVRARSNEWGSFCGLAFLAVTRGSGILMFAPGELHGDVRLKHPLCVGFARAGVISKSVDVNLPALSRD